MTTAIDTRMAQREESMKRLRALRLHENVVRDFISGKLNLSERTVFPGKRKVAFGILYYLDESEKRAVEEFETEYEAVVYHVMKYLTEFGTQYGFGKAGFAGGTCSVQSFRVDIVCTAWHNKKVYI